MKIGRNDPCPCGSGKKYKRCCELKAAMPGDWFKESDARPGQPVDVREKLQALVEQYQPGFAKEEPDAPDAVIGALNSGQVVFLPALNGKVLVLGVTDEALVIRHCDSTDGADEVYTHFFPGRPRLVLLNKKLAGALSAEGVPLAGPDELLARMRRH